MNLDKIFNPKSIAIIGASDDETSVGYALFVNANKTKHKRKVFPVNIKKKKILGHSSFASVLDIKQKIDLAVIATPASTVPYVLADCAKAGIKGVVIISAGFNEVGKEGLALYEQIRKISLDNDMRLVGPNCLGFIIPGIDLNMSFATEQALLGQVALISQSGAICTAILDWSIEHKVGFSNFVSIGAAQDVGFSDLIEYMANDKKTTSIVLYMESLKNPARFIEVCRRVSKTKPIFVLKSGRSAAGASAAKSHTGSLAGNDKGFDALFRQAGVVRLDNIQEVLDIIMFCSSKCKNVGKRLAIITNAGGPGVISTDSLYKHDGELAKLSKDTIAKLNTKLPSSWSKGNPIDVIGDADPRRFKDALDICIQDKKIDSILILLSPQAMTKSLLVAKEISKIKLPKDKFIFAVFIGGSEVDEGRKWLEKFNIAIFETPERAIISFMKVISVKKEKLEIEINKAKLANIKVHKEKVAQVINKVRLEQRKQLSESEAKEVLSHYNIPVLEYEIANSEADAISMSQKLSYPVAMKILSPDILHKIDCGGVALNINSQEEARLAYTRITRSAKTHHPKADIKGVYIEPMLRSDLELIIGLSHDPVLGPLLMFGRGGSEVELYKDISFVSLPLQIDDIIEMIAETKVYERIKGYRNMPGIDLEKLLCIIYKVTLLIQDFPVIRELDINPLSVHDKKATVLDAKIILQ